MLDKITDWLLGDVFPWIAGIVVAVIIIALIAVGAVAGGNGNCTSPGYVPVILPIHVVDPPVEDPPVVHPVVP